MITIRAVTFNSVLIGVSFFCFLLDQGVGGEAIEWQEI